MKEINQPSHENPNNDSPEISSNTPQSEKDRIAEINKRYNTEREEKAVQLYNTDKEMLSLDPELQNKLSETEKQIDELRIRGRDHDASQLEQKNREELKSTAEQYSSIAKEIAPQFPMSALEASQQPIELNSKDNPSDKFSEQFYQSKTIERVPEDKIDANLLKKLSSELGQDDTIYKFVEHRTKQTDGTEETTEDSYLVSEYSNSAGKDNESNSKVFIGFAENHAGKYLKVFALDSKTIDNKKYTLEKIDESEPSQKSDTEKPEHPYNIMGLEMGVEILNHDLKEGITIENATPEQVKQFNDKLKQGWTEVNNLLSTQLENTQLEQKQFEELKNDLVDNFLIPYSFKNPDAAISPYIQGQEAIKKYRDDETKSRESLQARIDEFTEHFKEAGNTFKKLADQTISNKLNSDQIRELSNTLSEEVKNKIDLLQRQSHLAEEGLLNAETITKENINHEPTTQEQVDDILYFHNDRIKQIASLEDGTWQPPRRRRE